MKKMLTACMLLIFLGRPAYAQVPQLFNYQGIARDTAGNVLPNRMIGVQLSLLDGGPAGTIVYSENFTDTTNAFGLFAAQVGSGAVISGTFSAINWASGSKYLQTAIDLNGGTNYSISGTTQLLSVPYALYAQKAVVSISGAWNLNGNVSADTCFIGTTDNYPLILIAGNEVGGILDRRTSNAYWGTGAGGGNNYSSQNGGANNIGLGFQSQNKNEVGNDNTSAGSGSLYNNEFGSYNTAIGFNSLLTNMTGWSNTAVGNGTDIAIDGLSNATAIGNGAVVDASNKIRIGNSQVTVIEGQVPFTTPSDGRFKFNIHEDVKGLDFILRLRPVTYQFNTKKQDDFIHGIAAGDELAAAYNPSMQIRRTGFIAQEVEQAAKRSGYAFDGLNVPRTDREYYSLSYASFVVPLVKAVQEQNELLTAQRDNLAQQQLTIRRENKKIADQERQILHLARQLQELQKTVTSKQHRYLP